MISAVENEPRLSGMPGAYHLTHCTPSIITRAARTLYYYYHIVRQPDEGGFGESTAECSTVTDIQNPRQSEFRSTGVLLCVGLLCVGERLSFVLFCTGEQIFHLILVNSGAQGYDDYCRQSQEERREQRVDTSACGESHEPVRAGYHGNHLPDDYGSAAGEYSGNGSAHGHSLPEQGEEHCRAECRAESCPCVGYQTHYRAVLVERDDVREYCDNDNCSAAYPHEGLVGRLLVEQHVHIVGHGGSGNEQLGIRGAHDRREDSRQDDSGDDAGQQVSAEEHEYLFCVQSVVCAEVHELVKQRFVACGVQEDVAEDTDQNRSNQGDEYPDGGDDAGFLDEVAGLDRHESYQDMRHTEVAQTPGKTGEDSRPGNTAVGALKQVEVVADDRAVSIQELYRGEIRGAENAHQRNYYQCPEHQQALYHVRPAHREESAEEGVGNNNDRADGQGSGVVQVKDEAEQLCAAAERRSRIDQEEHEDYRRAGQADNRLLCEEALLEVLRDSDGVAGGIGHLAELCREELPVEVCTDEQTDGDPAFGQTVQEDGAGESHQQPAAHIRRLGGDSGSPAAQLPSSYEIIVHALGFLVGHYTNAQHYKRINHKCDNYIYICHLRPPFLIYSAKAVFNIL